MLSNDRRRTPLTFADSPFSGRPVFEEYVHTVHPDTGLEVVFCPGEAKPQWLVDQEAADAPPPEPDAPAERQGKKAVKASQKSLGVNVSE